MNSFLKKYKDLVVMLAAVVVCYLGMSLLFGIACPFDFFFGVSCPGCGMTRAVVSAMRFDFTAAFYYHPLWILLLPVALLLLVFYGKGDSRGIHVTVWCFAIAMLVVYVYRMLFLQGEVVTFAPSQGRIAQWIQRIATVFE